MTARTVFVRAEARRDIAGHYRWLLDEAGTDVADRFLDVIDAEFAKLAVKPAPVRNAQVAR